MSRAYTQSERELTLHSLDDPIYLREANPSTSQKWWSFAAGRGIDLADRYGGRLATVGLYGSLAVIYVWFGAMKFTEYEARGIADLVRHSPILSWVYAILDVRAFSSFLGVLEIAIGALVAARLMSPALSLMGGLLSAGLFVTTLSFMATTPGVFEPELGFPALSVAPGQFLLKDIGLLAISIWIAWDSLKGVRSGFQDE
jgi:uncharacterized membrane protein YkgB